jgi:dihydrofolate reductase
LGEAIQQLKRQPGNRLFVGGVKLAQALTELGLIDEYERVVQPRLAGHGPTLFAGLSKHVDLKLVNRLELSSGTVTDTHRVPCTGFWGYRAKPVRNSCAFGAVAPT